MLEEAQQAKKECEGVLGRANHEAELLRKKVAEQEKEIKTKSLQFGEKEYYQVTVSHLQELQEAKDGEITELMKQHAAADKEHDEEVSLQGMCMCMRCVRDEEVSLQGMCMCMQCVRDEEMSLQGTCMSVRPDLDDVHAQTPRPTRACACTGEPSAH